MKQQIKVPILAIWAMICIATAGFMEQLSAALFAQRTGSLGAWVGAQAITAVLAVVLLAVGAIVVFQLITNIDKSGFPAAANSTLTSLETATQSAWAIGNLVPLVVFAVIIVGVVMGILVVRGRGGTFLEWAANHSPSTRLTGLLYDRSTGGWTGQMIVGAIITVIVLAVGAVIAFKVITSYAKSSDTSAAYNSTYDALITGTQSAWAIGNLIPLIVFAVIIVGVVMGLLITGRGSR